jgi:hypothetical protein
MRIRTEAKCQSPAEERCHLPAEVGVILHLSKIGGEGDFAPALCKGWAMPAERDGGKRQFGKTRHPSTGEHRIHQVTHTVFAIPEESVGALAECFQVSETIHGLTEFGSAFSASPTERSVSRADRLDTTNLSKLQ